MPRFNLTNAIVRARTSQRRLARAAHLGIGRRAIRIKRTWLDEFAERAAERQETRR